MHHILPTPDEAAQNITIEVMTSDSKTSHTVYLSVFGKAVSKTAIVPVPIGDTKDTLDNTDDTADSVDKQKAAAEKAALAAEKEAERQRLANEKAAEKAAAKEAKKAAKEAKRAKRQAERELRQRSGEQLTSPWLRAGVGVAVGEYSYQQVPMAVDGALYGKIITFNNVDPNSSPAGAQL